MLGGRPVPLPPAYELKAKHPFADTSRLTTPENPYERSHGNKLTPRLAGSVLLHVSARVGGHPYLMASIFGFLFLMSGVIVGYQISGDRIVGLFTGLLYSGLYAAATSFAVTWAPKPFDGIALGLLGLTLVAMRRPGWMATCAVLACWTDERSIISLCFVGLAVAWWPSLPPRGRMVRWGLLGGAVATYVAIRLLLLRGLISQQPETSFLGFGFRTYYPYIQLAGWTCLEGGWILVAYVGWRLHRDRARREMVLLGGALALAVASAFVALDVSRGCAFAFPLIPAVLARLKTCPAGQDRVRLLMGMGALVTLLAPNFEIIMGSAVRYIPSLVSVLFRL